MVGKPPDPRPNPVVGLEAKMIINYMSPCWRRCTNWLTHVDTKEQLASSQTWNKNPNPRISGFATGLARAYLRQQGLPKAAAP